MKNVAIFTTTSQPLKSKHKLMRVYCELSYILYFNCEFTYTFIHYCVVSLSGPQGCWSLSNIKCILFWKGGCLSN